MEVAISYWSPPDADASDRRRRSSAYRRRADDASEQIEQAIQSQNSSIEVVASEVAEVVTDPSARRDIEHALASHKEEIDRLAELSRSTVGTIDHLEKTVDTISADNQTLEVRVAKVEGQRNSAAILGASVAILGFLFRWPFLERRLKKLEIQERERQLRD